jgi:hypothetical protein
MQAAGWRQITRAAGSKGPVDLWMLHEEHGGACVQVKSGSGGLGPDSRADLVDVADQFGALPILARVVPRQGIEYMLVARSLTAWERWTP